MKQVVLTIMSLMLCILMCIKPSVIDVYALEHKHTDNINLYSNSTVFIDDVFGSYMTTVDENIYYSLSNVNSKSLVKIYGNHNTPMFNMAKDTINPCMALATTWGEAGRSYKGISLTTVTDFNPDTYKQNIDWIKVTNNLYQVDSSWYIANAKENYNTNVDGYAYHIPTALLQVPISTDRSISTMYDLGVGPYQITSTDWTSWDLDDRVNPIYGFEDSLKKCGSSWINCGIEPISDLTVYACLSLGHQGGNLITYDFGKDLINTINSLEVQNAFNEVGYIMLSDAKEKALSKEISLSDIDVTNYVLLVEDKTGINFSDYTGGVGSTNKGDYVARHLMRYVFYKYYYTSGL